MTALEEAALSVNLKFLLPLIYIFPTYFLYFYILYTIFWSKVKHKFTASFYELFGYSAVNYVIHSMAYYLVMRMTNSPFFLPFTSLWPAHGFIPTILNMILYYSAFSIHLYSLCLSFNRFTVFTLKIGYQKFWSTNLKYFLWVCVLTPLIPIWHMPFSDIMLKPDSFSPFPGMRYISTGNKAFAPWMDTSRTLGIFLAATSTISLGMNMFVVFQLLHQRFSTNAAASSHSNNKKVSPQDVKMCIYTIFIFGTEVISCCQQFAFLVVTDNDAIDAMFNIQYYLADVSTLAPAWFILFTNKNLRHQIAFYFCAMKPEDIVVPTSTILSHNALTLPDNSRRNSNNKSNINRHR